MPVSTPTLPDWTPPLDTGQPTATDLNDLSTRPRQTFAARNSIIPITYGRDRVFGKLCVQPHIDEVNGFLYVVYSFGEGEISAFETVLVDGIDVNDGAQGFLLNAGAEVEEHTGTVGQSVSTLMSGVLVGYTDTLPNTAYIVLKAPAGSTQGFPRCEAIMNGRKVYDPRLDGTLTTLVPAGSGTHRVGDPSTWEYSANPALCFRDLIENFTGWDIADQGVADLATYNEEQISGIDRRAIGLTVGTPATVEDWVKGFRTYMGAFIAWEDGKIRVVPNRADVEAPGAILLDGSASTWVTMGDQAELDFDQTQDFTIEFQFKMQSTTAANQFLVGKRNGASSSTAGYSMYITTSDTLSLRIHDGTNGANYTHSTTDFFDNEWHHVAMVIDQTANELTATIDNVPQTPVDISSVTLTLANAEDFRIGSSGSGTQRADVLIDEVRVWDDVRTPTEITDNQFAEIADPTSDASLVGYWKLNDLTSSPTAVDSSVSANDGTVSGAAYFTTGNPQLIPEGVAMHIGVDNIVKDSLKLSRRSLRSVPNSVAVDYEDSSGSKWLTTRVQSDSPRITGNLEARRLSRVSLPGIHNGSQAKREATERLNWYLTDLECTLTLFDEGWQLQHGSIVAVTHPIGLDGKLFRVTRITAHSGRWTVDLVEYDPAVYSDEVISDPTTPDTSLGNPLFPPLVTGLALAEELFQYTNGNTGSRIRVTWNATNYPFLSQYLVEGWVDELLVWHSFTGSNNVVTPPVEELIGTPPVPVLYEVRVYILSPFAQGSEVSDTYSVQGKLLPPGDVPAIRAIVSGAGQIQVSWDDAIDIDIWRYKLKQGTTSDTWETATQTDLMDDTDRLFVNQPLGTHRFFVKAVDSVSNVSLNAIYVDVTLSNPPAVTSVSGFEVASEVRLSWASPVGGYVARYRLAYSDIPETFETTLDIVDTLRFQTKDVPEGEFTFKVYARDEVGNEALTAATIDIEVTSDSDTFLADSFNFADGTMDTVTNMTEYTLRTDSRTFWTTDMGEAFAVTPTDFQAGVPLANYHSSGSGLWLTASHDFGVELTGSWNLSHDVTALFGEVTVALELSTDDVVWDVYSTSARANYRYARVRITTIDLNTAFVKTPLMLLTVNVVPLEESGGSSSSASIGKTINLAREYFAVKEINAQPKNQADALMAVVDNIVIGKNTGVQFDGTNYLLGSDEAAYDPGTGDFSVEFWAKHSGTDTTQTFISKKQTSTSTGWEVLQVAGYEIRVTLDDGTVDLDVNTAGDAFPADGSWHHVGVSVDRTANLCKIRVDGIEEASADISSVTGSLNNSHAFCVGARTFPNSWYLGAMDEVRVWGDVRTPTEFDDNRLSELDMTIGHTGLIGYWRLNGTTSASVTTEADASSTGETLTNTGAGDIVYVAPEDSNPLVKINSFDVYVFDIFGQQLIEEFQWNWKAV